MIDPNKPMKQMPIRNKRVYKGIGQPIVPVVLVLCILNILIMEANTCKYDIPIKEPHRTGELSIASWNSRGLVASIPYLKRLMQSNDVICLSEHWLHSNRLNRLGDISDDFNIIARASAHSDACTYGSSRGQGGVAIMWRKSLGGISPMTQITHDRICGIRAQTNAGFVMNIFSVYLPAPGSSDDYDVTLDEVAEIINTDEKGTCTLLCGDFNADMGFLGGKRSSRKPTSLGRKLSKFLADFDLFAVNMLPITKGPLNTFNGGVGSSTIDYITIPKCLSGLVHTCEVVKEEILNTSDHFVVRCTLKIGCAIIKSSESKCPSRIKWGKIRRDINETVYSQNVELAAFNVLSNGGVKNLSKLQVDETIDMLVNVMVKAGDNLPKSK